MKNFSNKIFNTILLLTLLFATLAMGGCVKVADSDFGSDITPESQTMVMRHLKYQGNKKICFNSDNYQTDTVDLSKESKNLIETRLYRTDSILASNLGVGYMGVRRSDVSGQCKASFASTMLFMNAIDEEVGFGYKPIFDTMKLILSVSDYGGDTLIPIRYKVYELKKPLEACLLRKDTEREDTLKTAYMNWALNGADASGLYEEDKPIFEFTFPNKDLKEGPSTVMIPMENTDNSWNFVRRLMLIPDNYADANSDWDGYGRSGIEVYSDDTKWKEQFYGLYIAPAVEETEALGDVKEGAMYALDLTASGIMLQGRSRNPNDPSMIKDTVGMYYYFCDESSTYNVSVNRIERDANKVVKEALVQESDMIGDNRPTMSTCYVEGLGGPYTEIYFTDSFLNELFSLNTYEDAEYSKMGINQCLMSVYVVGASYVWSETQGNAGELAGLYDIAFTRFGTYTRAKNGRMVPITDYNYQTEEQYGNSAVYNGYLDRSRGCYNINVTAHIQQLYNYAKRVRYQQEDGSYGYAFNTEDNDYVCRTIYIGAEATNLYSFAQSTVQGMANGDDKAAPIQIDLTYTLIK